MTARLFRLPSAAREDAAVDAWFAVADPIRELARGPFARMRAARQDVRVLIHDHSPTACVGDAAFGYVGAHATHVSVGFFDGADLPDPAGLLQGAGKHMRHVKLRGDHAIDEPALWALIAAAYAHTRAVLAEAEHR